MFYNITPVQNLVVGNTGPSMLILPLFLMQEHDVYHVTGTKHKEHLQHELRWRGHGLYWLNSLAPGKFERNFRYVILKQILVIDGWGISCEIVLIWKSMDFTDDQSTLIQVMAWCHQATSHYLSQYWPGSLSPYGFTRPQWVSISQFLTLK